MRKRAKATRFSARRESATSVFAKAVKDAYSKTMGTEFYTTNSFADRYILGIKVEGNVFKVIKHENEAKIVARIDNAVYNFPVIIADQGSRAKLAQAYAELKERGPIIAFED